MKKKTAKDKIIEIMNQNIESFDEIEFVQIEEDKGYNEIYPKERYHRARFKVRYFFYSHDWKQQFTNRRLKFDHFACCFNYDLKDSMKNSIIVSISFIEKL